MGGEGFGIMNVGFLGVGEMGKVLLMRASISGFWKYHTRIGGKFYACDHSAFKNGGWGREFAQEHDVKIATSARTLAKACDLVILAVKPKDAGDALDEMREGLKGCAVASVIAGWTYAKLREHLDESTRILTLLPNMPMNIGAGVIGITESDSSFTEEDIENVKSLFSYGGYFAEVTEAQLPVLSAISGSGPAFIALFAQSMANAGIKLGLDANLAQEITARTICGTGHILEFDKSPQQLVDQVCSPNGTSIEGVKQLEKDKLEKIVKKAIDATISRWNELA